MRQFLSLFLSLIWLYGFFGWERDREAIWKQQAWIPWHCVATTACRESKSLGDHHRPSTHGFLPPSPFHSRTWPTCPRGPWFCNPWQYRIWRIHPRGTVLAMHLKWLFLPCPRRLLNTFVVNSLALYFEGRGKLICQCTHDLRTGFMSMEGRSACESPLAPTSILCSSRPVSPQVRFDVSFKLIYPLTPG